MYEQNAPSMTTQAGKQVALQSVSVGVLFQDLLCETTMSQVYQNMEKKPIEAVYTFPLATSAVLLGLQVVIGGKMLVGKVVGKVTAVEKYEDAIGDGDSAVMLEQVGSGLYTMNVGNVIAGEEVSITIIYAELFSWQGDTLRFFLPTTIAPRYGSAEAAGLQPQQVPEIDFLTENRLQLTLTIVGTLAEADITSPSHQLALSRSQKKVVVTLGTGETFMDRDFILNIRSNRTEKDSVQIDHDLEGGCANHVALASFSPCLPAVHKADPRSIKIIVDCSGSMSGDSISQARQAISDILNQLRPEDYFNLVAFGTTHIVFFASQMLASKENITNMRRFLRRLDADMGGTEIRAALQAAIHISGPDIPQDILLITDGEVWDDGKIISMAEKSGHRVFTVGVGSSVSEDFVRKLAQKTGGAYELVTPCENMAERIVRHFQRIYLPRTDQVEIHWPIPAKKTFPKDLGPIYDGDTLHAFAWFDEKPSGLVVLKMTLADGRTLSQTATIQDLTLLPEKGDELNGSIARVATSEALGNEDESAATALAVQYQLVSPYTNYLVVAVRADNEKSQELPALRKVPQMLAAGWGGNGGVKRVRECSVCYSMGSYLDGPSYLRKRSTPLPCPVENRQQQNTPAIFIKQCNRFYTMSSLLVPKLASLKDLQDCDLPEDILSVLRTIAAEYEAEVPEELIVAVFLFVLTQSIIGKQFNREATQAIKHAHKVSQPDQNLIDLISAAFNDISNDDWGIQYLTDEKDTV